MGQNRPGFCSGATRCPWTSSRCNLPYHSFRSNILVNPAVVLLAARSDVSYRFGNRDAVLVRIGSQVRCSTRPHNRILTSEMWSQRHVVLSRLTVRPGLTCKCFPHIGESPRSSSGSYEPISPSSSVASTSNISARRCNSFILYDADALTSDLTTSYFSKEQISSLFKVLDTSSGQYFNLRVRCLTDLFAFR